MEFSQAGNIIPTGKVSVEAHITYLVLYARHLAKIGNLEKGLVCVYNVYAPANKYF